MELEDPLWPTRALLNEDEERAAALADALLREPEVELTGTDAQQQQQQGRLLVVAASAAAAALVGHCLCSGTATTAAAAGRVSLAPLPTPRMPTGEAGAAGGGRRKPSGAADEEDNDEEEEEGGAKKAGAGANTQAGLRDRDQDPSSLPVPDYCRGCDCPLLACEGALVAVATPAPPGSAAAAAIASSAAGGAGGSSSSSTSTAAAVPEARAGAWARGVLGKLRPSRVLVVTEAQGEQYRGEGDPSEGLLAFTLRTSGAGAAAAAGAGAAATLPPPLPAGTVVGGLAAALVAECELAGIPALALVAVETVPALTAAHAPGLGRAAAAAARALGGSGGGGKGDEAAVAARLEVVAALHAARHDMERALPAGGVYT